PSPSRPSLPGNLLPHRHEFLGRGGMNADRGIELRLRRVRPERHREPLDDLSGVRPDHVATEDAIGRAIDDELHERLLVPPREGMLERAKRRTIDVDCREIPSRLAFGEADRTEVRT